MKLISARNGVLTLGLFAMFGCSICDDDNDSAGLPLPVPITVRGFWPCIGPPGTSVRVFGSYMPSVQTVTFGGGVSRETTNRQTTSADVTVPVGATTSTLLMYDFYSRLIGTSPDPFTVGDDTVVPEIEPNEDNPAATPMGPRTRGSGTLANVADRDHFERMCFMVGARYSVFVQPPVVGVVYVNNLPVTLDASGRGEFNATAKSLVFGLTGATGAYQMTIGFVNP